MNPALVIDNVSKCFEMYSRPIDRLKQMLLPSRKLYREFWALKEVNLSINRFETLGIIGKNGSGKSTLLQIIAGTLTPSNGEVRVAGKIAALLELGAGFNPEFTGIENVFLSCSIYGLEHNEIESRLQEIIDFAGIGEHLYEPVKTYSSGMFVRLAFAVIAHVDADILIIDEALSVGDAVFTQKCMRYIREFRTRGTLIFVSHDMASIVNLCQTAVWLDCGAIKMIGDPKSVSQDYLRESYQSVHGKNETLHALSNPMPKRDEELSERDFDTHKNIIYSHDMKVSDNLNQASGWKTGKGEITSISLVNLTDGQDDLNFKGGELVKLVIKAVVDDEFDSPILGFLFRDRLGQDLFGENTYKIKNRTPIILKRGEEVQAEFQFTLPMLPNGQYAVMASLANGDLVKHVQHHWLNDGLIINVNNSEVRYGLVGLNFNHVTYGKI